VDKVYNEIQQQLKTIQSNIEKPPVEFAGGLFMTGRS
jgi:hypothetical protein